MQKNELRTCKSQLEERFLISKYRYLEIQIGVIMTFVCERCKLEITKYEICNYCGRKLGNECIKSSMRVQKVTRLVICKDDWGDVKKRTAFKNRKGTVKDNLAAEAAAQVQSQYRGNSPR